MARNLSVFGSDHGRGRGGAAPPFLTLHREMSWLFDDVFRSTPVPFDQSGRGDRAADQRQRDRQGAARYGRASRPFREGYRCGGRRRRLTIRAEKKVERKEEKEKENYYFVESAYGTFQRSLRLPFSVDAGQVQAQFENGVLTVTLLKP